MGVIMFHGSIGAPMSPISPSDQTTHRSAVKSGTSMPCPVRNAR